MKKKFFLTLLILVPIVIAANGSGLIERLYNYLSLYNQVYPEEKVYIQTDKTYYKPSEHIWYKALLLGSNDNKPSAVSDVLYVELKDPKGNIIFTNTHNTLDGTSDGKFYLEDEAPGGIYTLVGYTKWMKNAGEELFFKKEITVQRVITPRLLLKLEFEKRAYGPGDEVVGMLSVSNLRNEKTEGSSIQSTVKIGGATIETINNTTKEGEAKIKFRLPENLNTTDGILQVVVNEKGLQESIIRSIPIVLDKIQVQFLPEGGDLIAEAPGKVAFKALNEFGKGADVSGKIVDETGNTVASFESFHLGMGAVEFTPKAGKSYFAKIEKPLGNPDLVALPEVSSKGYSLNLKSKKERTLTWSVYAWQNTELTLVGQTQGEIYYAKKINLKKGTNKVTVDTNNFPIGVAVFTLFDESDKEAAERLVYLNPEKGLKIQIEPDKQTYAPKEEVKLNIKTTDKDGKPVAANLGLSVVDEQLLAFADDKQDNLLSYILFSSELKGEIQEPFFYFDETQAKAKEAVDYLMLTHGWRRFAWNDIYKPSETHVENAEKISSVYGYVQDVNKKLCQADVYLIEKGGRRKIAKLRTTSEGYFAFHNIDITQDIVLVTAKPNYIKLFKETPQLEAKVLFDNMDMRMYKKQTQNISMEDGMFEDRFASIEEPVIIDFIPPVIVGEILDDMQLYSMSESMILDDIDIAAFKDSRELSETVVIGYGTSRRSDITGAVTSVSQRELSSAPSAWGLSGRISGISVQPFDVTPNASGKLAIQSNTSFGDGNNGFWMLRDNILFSNPISNSQSVFDLLDSNRKREVSIFRSPANIKYLGRALNGVVYIETTLPRFRMKTDKSEYYNATYLSRRTFYKSSEFTQRTNNYDMLNSTVYWNAQVKTDKKGEATVTFQNNDASSSFRITTEGVSPFNGLIGSTTCKISTQKPFSIDVKTPFFVGYNDIVEVPVMVKNNTNKQIQADVRIDLPAVFSSISQTKESIQIDAQATQMVYFRFSAKNEQGDQYISISGETPDYEDKITSYVTVRSIYFPAQYGFSGREMDKSQEFEIASSVKNSIKAEVVCYTNFVEELFDGVESIFRQPSGCFEQVSSSTFPNIFALQLLNAIGSDDERVRERALTYLELGYKKLAAYEVKGTGGFEWYGGSPAHEVLSAYGLVEFYEMNKVYNHIDKQMMERTRKFILSRKNGTGGFKQNNGMYGFSGAPEKVNNAYIVYALTETGNSAEIEKEYQATLSESLKSKDMYRMALMANAAYNMKDTKNYNELMGAFKSFVQENKNLDALSKKAQASIVRSYDKNLAKETAAFWLLALLKSSGSDMQLIDKCVDFISQGRQGGSFGSTQTTTICLQALTKYAYILKNQSLDGFLTIYNNNEEIEQIDLSNFDNYYEGKMVLDISDFVKEGRNNIRITYSEMEKPYPFTVNVYWDKETPETSELCPLHLSVKLEKENVKRNETVRLSASLKNTKSTGQPMSIAIIGIPGGLSLQPWQLKEMQEKGVFDFYEIINDNLVAYYRELGPNEEKIINLDLKAEIMGTYKGMASSAYLYYSDVYKHWVDGFSVTVTE